MKNSSVEKKLTNFLLWVHYNAYSPNVDLLATIENGIVDQYNKAMQLKGKYCTCSNKGKAVNQMWKEWHCTYCLKPKKSEK